MHYPPFSKLAEVYDQIMADVEYERWCDFILAQAGKRGFDGGPILDLGCGTGNLTLPLARRGHAVTGVDSSPAMLALARLKEPAIEWLLADFTSLALPGSFELVVSVFDSLNNLLSPDLFLSAASRVRAHLQPGGLFLFDVNTTVGLSDLWEGASLQGWAGEIYYRWDHEFDPEARLARVEVFCDDGTRSFTEVHYERPYDPDEVVRLLQAAGFTEVEVITFPSGDAASQDEERIWGIGRAP